MERRARSSNAVAFKRSESGGLCEIRLGVREEGDAEGSGRPDAVSLRVRRSTDSSCLCTRSWLAVFEAVTVSGRNRVSLVSAVQHVQLEDCVRKVFPRCSQRCSQRRHTVTETDSWSHAVGSARADVQCTLVPRFHRKAAGSRFDVNRHE